MDFVQFVVFVNNQWKTNISIFTISYIAKTIFK